MKTVYIKTYGCASSQDDSEIMAGLLKNCGYTIASNIENADVFISNTCSVKTVTENKILDELKKINRAYPEKKIIVAGCLAEAEPDIIRKYLPHAAIISTNHVHDIAKAVGSEIRLEFLGKDKKQKAAMTKLRKNPVIDIVDIESGCSYACTFCSTKLAKGNTFSYPEEKIVEQIKNAKDDGCSEFWITGQDVADYNNRKLPELVNKISSSVRGRYFLRIGMMHPSTIINNIEEITEMYRNEKVFKFLHLPIQSGSDKVLKEMKRIGDIWQFIKIISSIRKQIPELTLWTDMIIGFPNESEDDFQKSMALLNKIKTDFVNISGYAVRQGTKAAKMKQLATEIKKQRTKKMSELVNKMSLEKNRKWLGWKGIVIIDEYNEKNQNWIGRNYAYKPVAIRGNMKLGQWVDVKIIEVRKTCLIGEAIY